MKHLFLIFITCLSAANASANRITTENMIRCRASVTPERCERQRVNALAKKCIEPAEYETLKALGGMPTCYEEDSSFMGWCPCGCFAAETSVKTDVVNLSLEESIKRVVEQFGAGMRPQVTHLSVASKIGDIQLKASPIRNASVGPEERPLIFVQTNGVGSAGQIGLTSNHPVLLADGSLVRAERLAVGQKLLNYLGQPETITSIAKKPYAGLVYNFNVDTAVDSEHVVVANGFLMGDLYLQGSLSYFENQILVRQ